MLKFLFQPIKIGSLEIPNRIVMPALAIRYDMSRFRDFYIERARGGAGLICCNLIMLDKESPGPLAAAIEKDSRILVLREMTGEMHRVGGKVAAQLAARLEWIKPDGTRETVGPSAVNLALRADTPARRAREAGFDAVELHALAGTSLLSQFLSPVTNQRQDDYGGSLEKRLRLLLEAIREIKIQAGADFPLIVRISGDDFVPGGYKLEESRRVAAILEKNDVNALNVSTGWYRVANVPFIQMGVAQGAWIYLAEAVKQAVSIPVIGGTNIRDPLFAERLLAGGKIDMVYIARGLIADPELPKKASTGRLKEICTCIACCHCMDSNFEESGLECAVNASAGREALYPVKPALHRKKVLVIGGGSAGMEAARVASLRGHRVSLWEKGEALGGQLLLALRPPRKQSIEDLVGYLTGQMESLGVQVRLKNRATIENILAEKADAVIVATGAQPIFPEIPGVKGANVFQAIDVLKGITLKGRQAAVVGGEMLGCETAEFLAEKGLEVTLLARRPRIADDMGRTHRWVMIQRLKDLGVVAETGVNVVEIKAGGAVGIQNNSQRFFPADMVVLAAGFKSDNSLIRDLQGKVKELYAIGDCVEPRQHSQRHRKRPEDGARNIEIIPTFPIMRIISRRLVLLQKYFHHKKN